MVSLFGGAGGWFFFFFFFHKRLFGIGMWIIWKYGKKGGGGSCAAVKLGLWLALRMCLHWGVLLLVAFAEVFMYMEVVVGLGVA